MLLELLTYAVSILREPHHVALEICNTILRSLEASILFVKSCGWTSEDTFASWSRM